MGRYKLIGLALSLTAMFQNVCFDPRHEGFEKGHREVKIRKLARMDFLESSGLEMGSTEKFWTHNDSGGDARLFQFDFDGELNDSISFGLNNRDWEDIARDDRGNWYLGEFGNNANNRQDLKIYIVGESIDSLMFKYPDQEAFPPPEDKRNFDCEAMFWHGDYLYLFSKNRGDEMVKCYRLEAIPGKQTAELIDTIKIKRMVTGADINLQGTEFSLLTYGMIYQFSFNALKPFAEPTRAIRFTRSGQSEGIAYLDNRSLLVSNEAGKIFRVFPK